MIYFSWATQIILAIISFLWLIPYYIAFMGHRTKRILRVGRKRHQTY